MSWFIFALAYVFFQTAQSKINCYDALAEIADNRLDLREGGKKAYGYTLTSHVNDLCLTGTVGGNDVSEHLVRNRLLVVVVLLL